MSQNSVVLPTTGTVSGLAMTQATNNALDTLTTMFSGASAPGSPIAGQIWYDTTNSILKKRNAANTAWISLFNINETLSVAEPAYSEQGTGQCNRIINAAMEIDQVNEGSSYSIPVNNTYTYSVDQWVHACLSSSASGVTAQRTATSPPNNFQYSLLTTVGTGASSVGATDYLVMWQYLEANNINDLGFGGAAAKPLSLSFWVKSSITGTFAVALQNQAGNRSLIRNYTISSANTWTFITLNNIPGDTGGSWVMSGNAASMRVHFTIAVGSTYQTSTLNAWQGGSFYGSTTQTNTVLTTSAATFQVSGVMLNAGAFVHPYEKKSAQEELSECQRYYEKTFNGGQAVVQNAGIATGDMFILSNNTGAGVNFAWWPFATRKRTSPTVVTYNPAASNANWRDSTASTDKAVATLANTEWGAGVWVNAGTAVGDNLRIHITANARF